MVKRKRKQRKRKRRSLMVVLVSLLLAVAVIWALWRLAYRPRLPATPLNAPTTAAPTPAAERIEPAERRLLEGILKTRRATPPR